MAGAGTRGPRLVGFYSAGLRESSCYGTCRPGEPGYQEEVADRARVEQLQRMHVTLVVNSDSITHWYHDAPTACLAYLADLRAHGIRASYSVAAWPPEWFRDGQFDPSSAQHEFALTDLDGDGVSDLDGRLAVLYQGHEVLEWATHEQRVAMYRIAKRWFPHTPIAVYYAGFTRPFGTFLRHLPHLGGPGGIWAHYAYGPGEADIVHLGIPFGVGGTRDTAAFRAEVRREVRIVQRRTPGVAVYVSTSFSSDEAMRSSPDAMWPARDLARWGKVLASVPAVRGIALRSFGRFRYDLANPRYVAQRAAWTRLGSGLDPAGSATPARDAPARASSAAGSGP